MNRAHTYLYKKAPKTWTNIRELIWSSSHTNHTIIKRRRNNFRKVDINTMGCVESYTLVTRTFDECFHAKRLRQHINKLTSAYSTVQLSSGATYERAFKALSLRIWASLIFAHEHMEKCEINLCMFTAWTLFSR